MLVSLAVNVLRRRGGFVLFPEGADEGEDGVDSSEDRD